MKFIGTLLILLSFSPLFAQEETNREVTTVNGQKCYVHVVESGNTLYSLHREYEVSVEEIKALNEGLNEELKVGQVLYIPLNDSNVQSYKLHIVEAGQTLYGISRIYSVSVDELIALNPEAQEGLKIGQQIKVPSANAPTSIKNQATPRPNVQSDFAQPSVDQPQPSDTVETHTVQLGETLYSISRAHNVTMLELVKKNNIKNGEIKVGQTLIIPTKENKEEFNINPIPFANDSSVEIADIPYKSKYKIAVILPFNISENQEVLSGMISSETSLNKLTDLSLDFYMGAKLALDSLEKLGLVADVKFYESKADVNEVKRIIQSLEFKNTDIVIGPLFNKTIVPVANWAKKNKARVIIPFNASTAVLKANPYISFAMPSELTLVKSLAHFYALKHGDDNVVLVKSGLAKDADTYRVFREEYNKLTTSNSYNPILKEITLNDDGKSLSTAIRPDTLTIFVDLSSDMAHVMRFLTVLNSVKNERANQKAEITAVGLKDWMKFENLSDYYKNRFQLHYASPNHLDYNTDQMTDFVLKYREMFNADPTKYSVQGYDVMFAYLNLYLLRRDPGSGLMNDIHIEERGEGNGTENGGTFILKQENFEIKRVGKIIDQKLY